MLAWGTFWCRHSHVARFGRKNSCLPGLSRVMVVSWVIPGRNNVYYGKQRKSSFSWIVS